MMYLKLMNLGLDLVHKTSDGKLTLEEVAEALAAAFPESMGDVLEEVKEGPGADGHVSVGEVMKIVSAVIF